MLCSKIRRKTLDGRKKTTSDSLKNENKNCFEILIVKEMGLDKAPIEFWKLVFLVPPIGVVLITGSIEFKAMFPCWWFEKGDKVERMMQIVNNSTQNWIFGILRETKSYLQPTIDHFFPTTCHKVWNTAHTSRGEFSDALRKTLSKIYFYRTRVRSLAMLVTSSLTNSLTPV